MILYHQQFLMSKMMISLKNPHMMNLISETAEIKTIQSSSSENLFSQNKYQNLKYSLWMKMIDKYILGS